MGQPSKKVLLVEDDASIRHMYQTKLEAEGFQVKTAVDGEDGYTTAKLFHPDVVLLDIMMPGVTGIDFLSYLRRLTENDNVKVIVLTNLDDPALKNSLREVVSGYVVKAETTPSEVAAKIRALFA